MDNNHSHLGQEKPMFFAAVSTEMVATNFTLTAPLTYHAYAVLVMFVLHVGLCLALFPCWTGNEANFHKLFSLLAKIPVLHIYY